MENQDSQFPFDPYGSRVLVKTLDRNDVDFESFTSKSGSLGRVVKSDHSSLPPQSIVLYKDYVNHFLTKEGRFELVDLSQIHLVRENSRF